MDRERREGANRKREKEGIEEIRRGGRKRGDGKGEERKGKEDEKMEGESGWKIRKIAWTTL